MPALSDTFIFILQNELHQILEVARTHGDEEFKFLKTLTYACEHFEAFIGKGNKEKNKPAKTKCWSNYKYVY